MTRLTLYFEKAQTMEEVMRTVLLSLAMLSFYSNPINASVEVRVTNYQQPLFSGASIIGATVPEAPRPQREEDKEACRSLCQPAITNDEVLALLASIQQAGLPRANRKSPTLPSGRRVKPGLQNFGRRHVMTSRAG